MLKITHADVTRQNVWEAFQRCHDVRLRERYHAVLLLLDGHPCPDIAQCLYRDEDTIGLWIHAVNEQGLAGLQRAPIPGRPWGLHPAYRAPLKEVVRQSPRQVGYPMSLWSTQWLKPFLYTRCGVESSRERVRQWGHELGFGQRRLRHRHWRAEHEEQAAFAIDLDILLSPWPEDWERLFVDAATVRRHPTLRPRWCLVDDVPEVPTGDDHSKIQVYGAVSPLTGRTHDRIRPTLSQGYVADFLKQLSRYYGDKQVLMIQDRARPHQGRVVDEVVKLPRVT